MKKYFLMAVVAVMAAMNVEAQIPAEVKSVMEKCQAAMNNPKGVEYNMDVRLSMGPVGMTTNFVTANKGEMERTQMTMKVLGKSVCVLSGFDGKEGWSLQQMDGKDTIRIKTGDEKKSNDGEIDFDIGDGFKKAKMNVKDDCYVIDYSDPIDKKSEIKKASFKISTKNYTLREMKTSVKGARVTMTVKKIKIGLSDDYFKLDLSKYPNAVVVRE
jgi:hypothetical protein